MVKLREIVKRLKMSSEIESLDINLLLQFHTILSLITCISISPIYNFPLFLFGIISIGSESSTGDRIRQFSLLLAVSTLLDLFWLLSSWRANTPTLIIMLIILNFCLKPITLLSTLGNLRARGEPTLDFGNLPGFVSNGVGSFGIGSNNNNNNNMNGSNRFASSNNQQNQTVWSAPGTYPEEEEEERIGAPRSSSHPPVPSKSSQQQNVQRGPTSVGTTEGGGYHTLE